MRIDATGITPTTLNEYKERLEQIFRIAFGANLNLDSETPQGQWIGIEANALADLDTVAVAVANGMNINTAKGIQLDAIGSILGIKRSAATRSTVLVQLSGTPGTVIRQGVRARTTNNQLFRLVAEATIENDGNVDSVMESVVEGPITVAPNTLTNIVDIVSGWTGVTNQQAASIGKYVETDAAFRQRYKLTIGHGAHGFIDALRSRILMVSGVSDAFVIDNSTNAQITKQNIDIPANSILCIVEGGTNDAIAREIALSKPSGVPTTGDVLVNIENTPIRFRRVELVSLKISITIDVNDLFPANGVDLIRQRIADYIQGRWSSGVGDFETVGYQIGQSLELNRLYSPINSVPGHAVTNLTVTKADDTALDAVIDLNQKLTITLDNISVTE